MSFKKLFLFLQFIFLILNTCSIGNKTLDFKKEKVSSLPEKPVLASIKEINQIKKNPKEKKDLLKKIEENIKETLVPMTSELGTKIMDCPATQSFTEIEPVPFKSIYNEFEYSDPVKANYFQFGLYDSKSFPMLLGVHLPEKKATKPKVQNQVIEEYEPKVIFAFRGEKSGFHKSSFSKPLLDYYRKTRVKDITMIMEELLYSDERKDLNSSGLMLFCHNKIYPIYGGHLKYNWSAIEGGASYTILEKIFTKKQSYEIISYSNGTVLRAEYINRIFKRGNIYFGYDKTKDNFTEFAEKYLQSTQFQNPKSKDVIGMIDLDGNHSEGKNLWDLAAFLKEEILYNPEKYYYAIVRLEENQAVHSTVKLIQFLELEGIEDETGIIRFTNTTKNLVIDVVTSTKSPYYLGNNFDLREKVKFTQANNPIRTVSHHGNVPEIGLNRFQEFWKKRQSN
ncbi:MAG: hypothetical protein SFU98_19755 [Leptospiraceae bacterium]|nr:hypothetical protein [Leptospiraceae bacterium]